MATKDTKAAKTWDDALEKKFLLEIIHELGTTVPKSVYEKIAARWGDPHTTGSLTIKFFRMKEKVKKELGPGGGGNVAPAKTPAKTAPKKRKAGKDDGADSGGKDSEKTAKKTRVTKPKAKTTKASKTKDATPAEEEVIGVEGEVEVEGESEEDD